MGLQSDCVTVTVPVSYKKFQTPNFATINVPPRPKQDGMVELPKVALDALDNGAFVQLVEAWVDDMYRTHKQERPPVSA